MPIKHYEVVYSSEEYAYGMIWASVVSYEPLRPSAVEVRRLVTSFLRVKLILEGSNCWVRGMSRSPYGVSDNTYTRYAQRLDDLIEETYGTRVSLVLRSSQIRYIVGHAIPRKTNSIRELEAVKSHCLVVEASLDGYGLIPYMG
jgi:hypothetical protein